MNHANDKLDNPRLRWFLNRASNITAPSEQLIKQWSRVSAENITDDIKNYFVIAYEVLLETK